MLRRLDIVLHRLDERREDTVEALLRDCTALLAHPHMLTLEEHRLHIGIPATTTHIRYRHERARLRTDQAPVILKLGLILKNGLGVNLGVVGAEALARVDDQVLNRQRVHLARIRCQIRCRISAGSHRLVVIRGDAARIVASVGQAVDIHLSRF